MDVHHLRKEYIKYELHKSSVDPNPIIQFANWFQHALDAEIPDVSAMTLATATSAGKPSARIVLLKSFGESGFVFYSNYEGRKGMELEMNPQAALLFFWKELERQVRIEGRVEKLIPEESDAYFASRPLESRISASISHQSKAIPSRRYLEEKWQEFLKDTSENGFKRPPYWGGYRLIPESIEFWQGRSNRLHDRILYSLQQGIWKIERLQP